MLCFVCELECSARDIVCASPLCSTCCHAACLKVSCSVFEVENIFWFCKICSSTLRSNNIVRENIRTNTQEHTQPSVSAPNLEFSEKEPLSDITKKCLAKTNSSITELSDVVFSLGNQLSSLSVKNSNLEARLDSVESHSKRLEVEITGIPYCKQENLSDIFLRICSLLNVSVCLNDITNITRIKPYSNSNVRKPIVIGFLNKAIRDLFLRSAKTCENLTLANLGFDIVNYRFFINEHLTSLKKNILYKVRKLRNVLKYRKLFVRNNKVFLIFHDNQVLNVENNIVLESLIRNIHHNQN